MNWWLQITCGRYAGPVAKNIQIKNVPDDVHATYVRRAKAAGQSLQEYLLGTLVADAGTLTVQEAYEQIRGSGTGSFTLEEAAEAVRESRQQIT